MDTMILSDLVWSLAAVFGIIGFVHLLGPRFLHDTFETWNYGSRLRVATGILEIGTALMLADPELRAWGIGLGALIMFAAVITLLNHRQYLIAIPSIIMMAALVPATLAVPAASEVRFAPVVESAGAGAPQNATYAWNGFRSS